MRVLRVLSMYYVFTVSSYKRLGYRLMFLSRIIEGHAGSYLFRTLKISIQFKQNHKDSESCELRKLRSQSPNITNSWTGGLAVRQFIYRNCSSPGWLSSWLLLERLRKVPENIQEH